MTTRRAEVDGRSLQRLVAKHTDPGITDRELLERFADRQDQTAFEALVRRHGPMVLAVGRRVLDNAHDAEDVFQATFLLLVQKASSQRWQPSVANWLHQTAHLMALKARRSATRRTRREGQVTPQSTVNPLAELTAQELLAVLDEELLALPEILRAPLVLCYLEGTTRDEAAERLGCPLGTLKKRLERGRDRLHTALMRRGIGLSAALLGSLLVGQSAAAVTAPLAQKTARTALALAGGKVAEGVISPRVGQLVNGGVGMTSWNKVLVALGVLLVGGLLAVAGADAYSAGADKPGELPANPPEPSSRPPAQVTAAGNDTKNKPEPRGMKERFRVRVYQRGPFRDVTILEDVVSPNEPFDLRAKDGAAKGVLQRTADGGLHFKGEVSYEGKSADLDTPVELGKGGIVSASPKRLPNAVGLELFSVMFTLSHVHEYVRSGPKSEGDQMIVVPGPKPKEQTPSRWFGSGPKAGNDPTADQETWLLFRSKQLNDFDRMWVERVERADDTFTVTMSRAIWLGPYSANATFHEVHGVNLGKLPAGKYTVKWVVRESGYEKFGKDGWPPEDRKPAGSAELKASFPVRAKQEPPRK
jgi:RNA polymerase sigma factor (sigma-70 family)